MVCSQAAALAATTHTVRGLQPTHAFVIGSDPVDGSTITAMPAIVRIFFNAPVSAVSFADIYTPDEQRVNARQSNVASNAPRELDTPLLHPNQLPQGSYTVRWTAIASDDGHTTHGVIGFNLGQSSAGLTGQTILGPSTSNILPSLNLVGILAMAWEWLVLMALTFWVGTLIFEWVGIAGAERLAILLVQAQKRTRSLHWLCLAALLVGECITLILRGAEFSQVAANGGIELQALGHILTQTTYGYLWFVRLGLILCALGLLWRTTAHVQTSPQASTTRRGGNRFHRMRQQVTQDVSPSKDADVPEGQSTNRVDSKHQRLLWLVLAGLLLLTYAATGDAAQLDQPHISAVVIDWLYLLARCVWFGGLAYLGYVLLPLLSTIEPDRYAEVLLVLLQRLLPLMLGASGLFLVSDLYLTEASIGNPQLFITDPYGRTALVASVLIGLMLLLSGYALVLLQPRLVRQAALLPVVNVELPARRTRQTALDATTRSLRQSVIIQAWLGAGVLLCAALMAFFAPPIVFPDVSYTQYSGSTPPGSNATAQQVQTQQVGKLTVTLQLLPGRVDYPNTVIVTMKDANGTLVSNAQVQLRTNMEVMDMGTSHVTISGGNPTYIATFAKDAAFSMFGRWDITLMIRQPGQAPLQTTFTINLTAS